MSIFDKYDLVDVDETFPIPELPSEGIVLLVGSSGSGKSTILRESFDLKEPEFNDRPIWENFSSPEKAEELLIACGLRTIPAWKRPFCQLSNGEAHRAFCAKCLDMGIDVIDEFTSVVDRNTAKSLSVALRKNFDRSDKKRLVIATCHRDIIDWLDPDHIYDTDSRQFLARGSLRQRPRMEAKLEPTEAKETWKIFGRHHYLSAKINNGANCWALYLDGQPIAMTSIIAYPSGSVKNAWREHRTVVLPEFQGLGIGNKLSNTIGSYLASNGFRFFSKTSHPSMGLHRDKSPLWRGTSKNHMARKDYKESHKTKEDGHKMAHAHRVCYSHEYIGRKL